MGKIGTIYKIENLVNGKVYIGQTIRSANRRWQVHKIKLQKQYHNNLHLQSAFNKYGEQSFMPSIIERCTVEDTDDREIFWIEYYKNTVGVYNIEVGGNNRKIITEETRQRLSEAGKKSYKNPDILKTRKKQWEEISGENHFNNKPVICVTDGNVFYSITAAAKHYGINMKNISQMLSGRTPYVRCINGNDKLEFEYYKEGKKYKPKQHIHGLSRKVICITTSEIFNSVTEASGKYNIPTTNISKACKGKGKYAGKLKDGTILEWKYA